MLLTKYNTEEQRYSKALKLLAYAFDKEEIESAIKEIKGEGFGFLDTKKGGLSFTADDLPFLAELLAMM